MANDLKQLLNDLWSKPAPTPSGKPGGVRKSGRRQIIDNARAILANSNPYSNPAAEALGLPCCKLVTTSLDTRGRPQKSIRVQLTPAASNVKINFRAYHVTWVAQNGPVPDVSLQYSHRCHNPLCVEPSHGFWEDDLTNKSRNRCQGCSHMLLHIGYCITVCQHHPACLSGVEIASWEDPRVSRRLGFSPPLATPRLEDVAEDVVSGLHEPRETGETGEEDFADPQDLRIYEEAFALWLTSNPTH